MKSVTMNSFLFLLCIILYLLVIITWYPIVPRDSWSIWDASTPKHIHFSSDRYFTKLTYHYLGILLSYVFPFQHIFNCRDKERQELKEKTELLKKITEELEEEKKERAVSPIYFEYTTCKYVQSMTS